MDRRRLVLLLGFALCVALPRAAIAEEEGGQVLAPDGSTLDDLDHRFRLTRPDRSWTLLPEERIREITPDAVAGANDPKGVWGAVIVERAPGLDLETFRDTVFTNLGAENKRRIVDEAAMLGPHTAWRLVTRGEVNGIPVFFRHLIVAREGHVYQVICWMAAQGAMVPPQLARMERAFSMTEGPVRLRRARHAVRDLDGAGWRVRGGAFESAAYRLRVEPAEGWRIVTGSELRNMNGDAEVGLVHSVPECYMVVIPELFAAEDATSITDALRAQMKAGYGEPDEERRKMTVMGQSVLFDRYLLHMGADIEFWHGVLPRGRIFYQILAWQTVSGGNAGREAIARGLSGVRHLDDASTEALARELAAASAARSVVGPDFALRSGLYRHFGSGFRFRTPPGYWRVLAGQEARAVNEVAVLVVQDPERGLTALVILDPALEMEEAEYHDVVVGAVWDEQPRPPDEATIRETIGGLPARTTTGTFESEGLPMWYRATSLLYRGVGVQVHAFGHMVNRPHLEAGVGLLMTALSFPEDPPPPVSATDTAYEDQRLGFRFRTEGTAWRFEDETPPAIAAVGTVLSGTGEEGLLLVMGLQALQEGQDESFFLDMMRQVVAKNVGDRARVEFESEDATWRGLKAARIRIRAGAFRGRALLVQRGQLTYLLLSGREDGREPDPAIEDRLELLP